MKGAGAAESDNIQIKYNTPESNLPKSKTRWIYLFDFYAKHFHNEWISTTIVVWNDVRRVAGVLCAYGAFETNIVWLAGGYKSTYKTHWVQ